MQLVHLQAQAALFFGALLHTNAEPTTTYHQRRDAIPRPTYSHVPASIMAQMTEEDVNLGPGLNHGQHVIGFGSNGRLNGKLTYTNADGQPVKFLSMDEFEDELQLAYCEEHSIEIAFKEEVEFDDIKRDWAFINDHEDNHVLFITTSQQCDKGSDVTNNLQPWIVSGAQFDENSNNVTLIAEPREFKDLPYQMHIQASGQGKPLPQALSSKRDEEPTESEEYTKPGDMNLDVDIPEVGLTLGGGGDILKSLTGQPPDVTIACMNCSIRGGMDFDFRASVDHNSKTLLSGGITLKAKDVGATIRVLLSINSVLKDALWIEQPVFGFVPMGLGFYFGKIIDIGPTVILLFRLSIGGNEEPVVLQSGFEMSIDPDAEFKLDFADPTNSDASGWKPKFEALEPRVSKGDWTLQAQAGPRLQFVIAGKVLTMGAEAGFDLGGGNIQLGLTQGQGKETCGQKHSERGSKGGDRTEEDTKRPEEDKKPSQEDPNRPEEEKSKPKAQAANPHHRNGTAGVNGTHHSPRFLEYDIGIENEILAFADAQFFDAKAYAGHTLMSSSKQLTKTCKELPRTTEFLTMNTALVTPSVDTFEAKEILSTAISAVTEAVSTASSFVSSAVHTATEEVSSAVETATSAVASVTDAIGDGVGSAWDALTGG